MVNVIASRTSIPAVINVALTVKELRSQGKSVNYRFVGSELWENVLKFTDPSDRSLVILDVPLPKDVNEIKIEPGEVAVLYVPSKLNSPTRIEREILTEKGISVTPDREVSRCFLGDHEDEWVKLNEIISMERAPEQSELEKVRGIIQTSLSSMEETVERVIKGEDFKSPRRIVKRERRSILLAEKNSPEVYADLFEIYVTEGVEPMLVHGAVNAIFTVKPTFFLDVSGEKLRLKARFGKGAVLEFGNPVDQVDMGYFLGIGGFPQVVLKISKSTLVSERTLHRLLVGGRTVQRVGNKTYVKQYHGLSRKFKGIKFISHDHLLVPDRAFEETVAVLKRSGVNYRISEFDETQKL